MKIPPQTTTAAEHHRVQVVIMALGASLRGGMDATMQAGVTRLLLQALVPAVIFRSLSSISVSSELASFVAGGAALVLLQVSD